MKEAENYMEQVKRYMELRHYSPRTIKTYLSCLRRAVDRMCDAPEKWTEEDIGNYLLYLRKDCRQSSSSINQAYSVLKILREKVLGLSWSQTKLPRSRRERRLPVALSEEEVKTLLEGIKNLKHRSILELLYTSGIRLDELLHLQLRDIDSKRMQIRVEQGKGRKDRYTLLSEKTLQLLRTYYKAYHPRVWLFEGIGGSGHSYSARSVQQIFKRAKARSGIRKSATVHTLRHSFATHLLDAGVDVLTVQDLLGHKSLNTTMRYLRVRRNKLAGVSHPLDAVL